MLADRTQLDRWRRLLESCPPDSPPARFDIDAVAATLATLRGRFLHRAILQALQPSERGSKTAWRYQERLIATAGTRSRPLGSVPARRPASEGAGVTDAVWNAYFRWRLGDADADGWLQSFIATLSPTALVFALTDNPEPWWRHEMMILHALQSYALWSASPERPSRLSHSSTVTALLPCIEFHLEEIQPDHATNDPWAVHAYAAHADGNVTAESLWHAAHLENGGRPGAFARLLAADAATALAAWLSG